MNRKLPDMRQALDHRGICNFNQLNVFLYLTLKGVARVGPVDPVPSPLPIECYFALLRITMNKFQIFRLNFTRDLSKMYYFSNKFSKLNKLPAASI